MLEVADLLGAGTMTACADWLAAQYLHERGLPHPNPPCDHPPADCPPLTDPTPELRRKDHSRG